MKSKSWDVLSDKKVGIFSAFVYTSYIYTYFSKYHPRHEVVEDEVDRFK